MKLTPLDVSVLRSVVNTPGRSHPVIAKEIKRTPEDVRLVLRGYEHLGVVVEQGGRWHPADEPRAARMVRERVLV